MYISAEDLPPDLRQIMLAVEQAAQARAGACVELLMLLRLLEELHRAILEGAFRESLPNTRQALYRVLQDLEEAGDWPYLPRLHIQALMQQLKDWPALGRPTMPTSAINFSSRRRRTRSPASPLVNWRGARLWLLKKWALPKPPLPPRATSN